MQNDAGAPLTELRVDGGAAANDLLMQFQADLLGVPVLRPRVLESTALGAAHLAGLAIGLWNTPEDMAAQRQIEHRFTPQIGRWDAIERTARWHEAVRRSLKWEEPA